MEKKIRLKKCKVCGNEFQPFKSTESVCGFECAVAYGKNKVKKDADREWQREKKKRKEALMSQSEWLNVLQKVFNSYIRARDKGLGCISCGTKKLGTQYAAGHFFSRGAFPSVRFDEDNVHLQCNNFCNKYLSGNITEYRPRLIEKIGIERFNALEFRARNETLKLSIPEIQDLIKVYKQKTKEL